MNQPGDLSYAITEVLRLNRDRSSPLFGLVEPSRIGAAGHSAGRNMPGLRRRRHRGKV